MSKYREEKATMNEPRADFLEKFFKTLADVSRLRIMGLLSEREYSVGELAETLDLTEPTVSHHLSRLRHMGLLNLRSEGNRRYYRLNAGILERMNRFVDDLEDHQQAQPDDDAWIEALDLSPADRKAIKDFTYQGRLKQIPSKHKKLLAILRWLATQFEPGRHYTEDEVNTIIRRYHDDYAFLRRALIDEKLLLREGGGGRYWLAEQDTP
jgi:predicted transcriptional regulator